jgi:hypothetical protein
MSSTFKARCFSCQYLDLDDLVITRSGYVMAVCMLNRSCLHTANTGEYKVCDRFKQVSHSCLENLGFAIAEQLRVTEFKESYRQDVVIKSGDKCPKCTATVSAKRNTPTLSTFSTSKDEEGNAVTILRCDTCGNSFNNNDGI